MPYSPPPKRTVKLHSVDVQQTQLQGNWYTPVDGRVKIAEQADPALIRKNGAGYHVVSVQIIQVADKWAYHCLVEYPVGSGVVKPGTDFIDTKDMTGIAKAETSAIGRALGLHGIAIEESIASAEEMHRVAPEMDEGDRVANSAVQRAAIQAPARQQAATPPTSAAPSTEGLATDRQIASIRKLSVALGRPEPAVNGMTFATARDVLTNLSQAYSEARRAS